MFVWISKLEYFTFGESFASYMAGAFGFASIVVLPPITMLGAILPAVWFSALPQNDGIGRLVARTTVINSLAAAVAAASTSLIMVPAFGLWNSFVIVASLFIAFAVATLIGRARIGTAAFAGMVFASLVVSMTYGRGPDWMQSERSEELVRRWESSYGWIDVVRSRDDGSMSVRQNLHYRFGNTGSDASRALRQAFLPLVLHSKPADVLFVGLGTGLTPAGGLLHPDVERIVVVELVPEVVDAARLLSEHNYGVVDHPRVSVAVDDARHFLRATERLFDVIIADLFVQGESETGYLYTVEHFQAARRRLRQDGLFCQWLPVYQLGKHDFELIVDSFAPVFPETSLWWGHLSGNRAIIALIGTDRALTGDDAALAGRLQRLWRSAPADEETAPATI